LAAEYGCRLVVLEAEVDAFGQEHAPPVTGSFEDLATSKTIRFWTKPIAKLPEVSVYLHMYERNVFSVKEWSPTYHDNGALWTLAAMTEVRMYISLGVTNSTSADR
jgi:hypothetical protein